MESFFSTVKSELVDRFDSFGAAKMELFDYLEVFYNQRRRHSTLGQISPGRLRTASCSSGVTKPSTESDQAHTPRCSVCGRRRFRRDWPNTV